MKPEEMAYLRCLAVLTAIAFDGTHTKEEIQKGVKAFLKELPPSDIAMAVASNKGLRIE